MAKQEAASHAPAWCIGLMTGTALDGQIDVALVKTDGVAIDDLGPYALVPYSPEERALLASAIQAALAWDFDGPAPPVLDEAETLITRLYAGAVETLIETSGLPRGQIAAVGGHGLTVLHRPDRQPEGRTLQLLNGARLARMLNLPVVCDFRSADVAAGGQGAPLAPVYHAALLEKAGIAAPACVLNLGGVANITWWDGADGLVAFDTGPANGPINEWVEAHGCGSFDAGGRLASAGRVDEGRLLEILDHPWFAAPPPKSLDRYDLPASLVRGMALEDGAATLTALCAVALASGLEHLPERPTTLVVAGGGRHNPVLMDQIAARCGVAVVDADTVGLRGDAVEAECFAFLAMRSLRALPLSFPGTTGVPVATSGGQLFAAGG